MSSKSGKPSKGKPSSKSTPKPKSKGKGGNNTLVIMAVVGVLLLVGVGIGLYFLLAGGSSTPTTPANNNANNNRNQAANNNAGGGNNAAAADPGSGAAAPGEAAAAEAAKAAELVGKLAVEEEKAKATKDLKDMIKGASTAGAGTIIDLIKAMAKTGSQTAKDLIKSLSEDSQFSQQTQMKARSAWSEISDGTSEGGSAVAGGPKDDPSNTLPEKTDVIFAVNIRRFLESPYSSSLLSQGAFRKSDYDKRLGIDSSLIETAIISGVKDFNQVVCVIRTSTPFNWEEMAKALEIATNTPTTVKGKQYFTGKIDFLNEFIGTRVPGLDALRDKAAFWRKDSQTLVYGDVKSIEALLETPPEVRNTPPPEPPPAAANSGDGRSIGGDGPIGVQGPGAAGGGGDNSGRGAGNSGIGGDGPIGISGPGGAPGSGGVGASGPGGNAPKQEAPKASPLKDSYLTIEPKLKRLLTNTEDADKPSLVVFAEIASSRDPVPLKHVYYLSDLPQVQAKEVKQLVFALPKTDSEPVLRIGLACESRREVAGVQKEVEKLLTSKGKNELRELFGFIFKLQSAKDETAADGTPGGSNPAGAGAGRGGVPPQGIGPSASDPNAGRSGAGAGMSLPPQGAGGAGAGAGMSLPPGAGGGAAGGNAGRDAGTGAAAEEKVEDSGLFIVKRLEEYILITMTTNSKVDTFNDKHLKPQMAYLRGSQEMSSRQFRLGDLAFGLESMRQSFIKAGKEVDFAYPQGALPRAIETDRGNRAFPAKDRVSFLANMLPYLGDDRYLSVRDNINPNAPWHDSTNLGAARLLVPHFLNPGSDKHFVKVRGHDQTVAATHFVGMAGVGPDAAYLPRTDKRAGMFGYDRIVKPENVKDGVSNTIYMIEADKAQLGPWIAGGGATVRGTSLAGDDVGKRGGFSSPNYNGQKGVWVVMGDGSTRFLKADIAPEVFKALCTIDGGDATGAIELLAPMVKLPVTARTEGAVATGGAATPAGGKKKVVEEEEETPKKK